MPLAVLERQAQAEYQRLPLSDVVGSLVETLDVLVRRSRRSTRRAGSRYRAGTLPAAVEVEVANSITSGSIFPHHLMSGDLPNQCAFHAKHNFCSFA